MDREDWGLLLNSQYHKSYKMMTGGTGVKAFEIINTSTTETEYVNVNVRFKRFSKEDNDTLKLKLRKVSHREIEEMVKNGRIDLDFCYVDGFEYSKMDCPNMITRLSARFALFDGVTDFNGAVFSESSIDFTGAMFRGSVFFENVDFGKEKTWFSYSQFSEIVTFSNISVADNIVFDFSCIKSATFYHSYFPKKVSFECSIIDRISFFKCIFSDNSEASLSFFSCVSDSVFLSNCTIACQQSYDLRTTKNCTITNCIVSGNIDFSKINDTNETGTLALIDNTSTAVIHGDWESIREAIEQYRSIPKTSVDIDGNEICADSKEMVLYNTYKARCDSFTILKENYHDLGKYDWEDKAYVALKRNERKMLKERCRLFIQDNTIAIRLKIILSWLIDIIGEYGTNPTKVAITMFFVYLFFSALFSISFIPRGGVYWWSGLYFSGITFLTIGYGEVMPMGFCGSFLAIVEGFIGMFLMSYFSVAVVRKTLR